MPPKHKHISWGELYTDADLTACFPDHPERFELMVGELDEKSTKAQLAMYEAMITSRKQEMEENKKMVKTLHFDILVKDNAVCDVDRDRLEKLWPAYCSNIHVLHHATGFNYDVMVKARMLVNGHQIVAVSRSVTRNEIMFAGTFNDAIDFVMGEVLNRVNKTQHTSFSRQMCSYGLNCIKLPADDCDIPKLKRLHSSGPVSVAIWSNGKKSMVRRQKGDKSDPEKGILYAVIKGLCYEKGGTKEYSRVLDMIHEALEERKNG